MAEVQREGMYLVLPVPFRVVNGEYFVEAQAANGLDRWADHFERLVVAAPVIPEEMVARLSGFVWRSLSTLEHRTRVMVQALPWAYSPGTFLREMRRVRQMMAASIAGAEHLQFAIGGLVGDWAAVAALEARKQKRKYAIHTDRVEHELIRKTAKGASLMRRLRVMVEAPLMERYHRWVIEGCSLGLWHGDDCYRAYAPWCDESHLVHDVHTKANDLIGAVELVQKLEDLEREGALRVVYAGRLDPMKAPLEWVSAIGAARDGGVELEAVWYGEGAMLDDARRESVRVGLERVIRFGGFVADRAAMLEHLRGAHALVFTHVTPESPRILIEALVSGTPILGYANAYAKNLLAGKGGGELVEVHDTGGLGALIAEMARDRTRLRRLTLEAAANGRRFTDEAVFAERSKLVKRFA
ncbi:glycosyltransferase [Granulicella tundricola]|uniref:Glycosyl transferase group 1 n=1 Tax=Granulicella tundricola (strain ATCC BAA-1859 / DSM 23138 / MP5ACTX9) TaxID=1198114 RepID=E8WWV9_GRATM|nr:glycosyltransferase [Granulicella tundricola]ADW67437.1 glycosyl transferase group 1 [Granulicella tundricola MP5ACTX9]